MSELKLDRRLRREGVGEGGGRNSGGMFSLFALPSSSSSDLRARLDLGVDSGVINTADLFDTTDDERDNPVRLPKTVLAVWERVKRRDGVVDVDAEEGMTVEV